MLNNKLILAVVSLLLLQSAIVFAGFVAPYDPALQNRDLPFVPPTRIHFVDARGAGHRHFIVARIVVRRGFRFSREMGG